MRPLVLVAVVAGALLVLSACGSSKPSYCSDVSNLTNSVKNVTGAVTSGGINALESQLTKIKSDATKVINSAKSDFPSETSALKSSVQSLETAVKGLPSNPSPTQIAGVGTAGAAVVSSVKNFAESTKSKCS
jgi:glycine cleavage system regulatory protein